MARDYRLISGDGHLEIPPERWTHRVPEKYRDRAPRRIRLTTGGDAMLIEGRPPVENPQDLYAGKGASWEPFNLVYGQTAGTGPPEQRLKEQDQDGMGAEVLFPAQVAGPGLWRSIADDIVYLAVVRAYNDWLAEEYCSVAPDRLVGMGVIPWTNADDAVSELEHCAKIGLKGVVVGVLPGAKGYPTPEDDKFWAAAVDVGLPLTVHVQLDRSGPRAQHPTFHYPTEPPEIARIIGSSTARSLLDRVARWGFNATTAISQLVLSGVFDRFPSLKILFAETRVGWLPFWLENADLQYQRNLPWSERHLDYKPLKRLPSEYIKEHIYWTILYERIGVEMRHHLGVDKIMFSTDFPHIECEWPNSQEWVEKLYHGVPADEQYQMLAGNTIKFFDLKNIPVRSEATAAAD